MRLPLCLYLPNERGERTRFLTQLGLQGLDSTHARLTVVPGYGARDFVADVEDGGDTHGGAGEAAAFGNLKQKGLCHGEF